MRKSSPSKASEAHISGPCQPFTTKIAKIGGKWCKKRKVYVVKLGKGEKGEDQKNSLSELTKEGLTVKYFA